MRNSDDYSGLKYKSLNVVIVVVVVDDVVVT